MRKSISVILFSFLLGITLGAFSVHGEMSDKDKCIKFLNDYGWEVIKTPSDVAEVTIPKTFDRVYENYNQLQIKSGFDLAPYSGKSGTRYTFVIKNYPLDTGDTVYANVITIDGKTVGGDIMTVSLSGFMHGLAENTP